MTRDTSTDEAAPLNNNISICVRFTRNQARVMDNAIRAGDYMNRSEAVRAAVRLLFDKDHYAPMERA